MNTLEGDHSPLPVSRKRSARSVKPRPEITQLPDVVHGALDYLELERLGLRPEDVLDFSENSNPYGPSPAVARAVANVRLDRYPDRESVALRRVLADHLQIPFEWILAGNGTAELLWLIALAYVRPGDSVLVVGPTFGEYANVARLMGGQVSTWYASAKSDFHYEPNEIEKQLRQLAPRLVFICTPNNPTGQALPKDMLAAWAKAHPGTLFVVDEAYINFSLDQESIIPRSLPNVLVLRSMTKDYALAGLRLGYAVSVHPVIQALSRVRPPWNVNALAQAAGVAALEDQAHLYYCCLRLHQDKTSMVRSLQTLGYRPVESQVHYFLMEVGSGAKFRQALLECGLLVRDCASFGLPNFVRIAVKRPEENARLLNAIAGLKGSLAR